MKNHTSCSFLKLIFLLAVVSSTESFAESWYLPACETCLVQVGNPSSQPLTVQVRTDDKLALSPFVVSIGAHQKTQLVLPEAWQKNPSLTWFEVLFPSGIAGQVWRNGHQVSSGRANLWQGAFLDPNASSPTLHIVNLSQAPQNEVWVENLKTGEPVAGPFSLPSQGQVQVSVPARLPIRVHGELALLAEWFNAGKWNWSELNPFAENLLQRGAVHVAFEMRAQNGMHSFVFQTSDPNLISQARQQLSGATRAQILWADVAWGSGEVNQDLASPWLTPWSWHVTLVNGFREFGAQSCNGDAASVEDHLLQWTSTHRTICFWGYQIHRELPIETTAG